MDEDKNNETKLGVAIALGAGIGFPCIYLYALRSLLAEYRKLSSQE